MALQHVKYLIVGGGVAGSAAVEAIRRHDPGGSVLFVGQETNRPYRRPPLSKQYLRRAIDRPAMSALPVGWYVDRKVELRTGVRVTRLDTARLAATLGTGEEISFDAALLATGASPTPLKIPGADLPGLHYLRTLDDADRLLHTLDMIRLGRPARIAVIGAGLIGTEVAATFAEMGLSVDLIESHSHPWAKIAGPGIGRMLTELLTGRGVRVHAGRAAVTIGGDGRVQGVGLSDGDAEAAKTARDAAGRHMAGRHLAGRDAGGCDAAAGDEARRNSAAASDRASGDAVACDFAVAAVGTTISRELLRGTPIAAETAILIDGRCQTSVRGIFAAGDCTAILDPLFGKHRVIDHLDHARLTGNIAGSNMAGGDERYEHVNHFWSEVAGWRLEAWGESKLVYRWLSRGDPTTGSFAEFGIAADDRIAQVIAVGRAQEHIAMRYCVEKRLNAVHWAEVLGDQRRDLNEIM